MSAALPGNSGVFSTTMRADGAKQPTYDGAPLYGFASDKKPGDTNGQGVGAVWWVITAS